MPFTRLAALAAAAFVAMLSGCSGGDNAENSPSAAAASGTAATASGGAGAAGNSAAGNSAATSETPAVAPTALPVIAARAAKDADTPLTVVLNEVRASDRLMTVTWSVRNDGDAPWSVGSFFSSGLYQTSIADALQSERNGNVDGIYVLDRVSARRYLPARDRDGNCVCTSPTITLSVEPGQQTPLQAVFQAPPATVPAIDVVIPHVGTFADVPVTR